MAEHIATMSPGRPDSYGDSSLKLPKFSRVVKRKLQSYTRTGQACDRCKVRPPSTASCLVPPVQADAN